MIIHTDTLLQIMGMKGEGYIDDNIWVAKSHHPIIFPNAKQYRSNKTFLCVRHPLDVFPSYA